MAGASIGKFRTKNCAGRRRQKVKSMTIRIPVPSGPGRTVEIGQGFEEQIKAKEEATRKRRELFDALARFIRNNHGWATSAPGHSSLRLEAKPDSDLPDLLIDRGFTLQPLGTDSRNEAGVITPVCVYDLRLPPLR